MTHATTEPARHATAMAWLCLGLIALPFLQALSIDFDRTAPLLLIAPALWFGRSALRAALASLAGAQSWLRVTMMGAAGATLLSIVKADQPAAAAATAAIWVLLAAGALLAGHVVRTDPRRGHELLLALALGTTGGTLAVWLLWLLGGRGEMPLYAHHRHLGLHTLAGAVASTALLVEPGAPRRARIGFAVTGAITWAGLLWSGGRGPVLALVVALGVWAAIEKADIRRAILRWSAIQLVCGLALSAVFWTPRAQLGWWNAFQRTAAAAESRDASALTSKRTEHWPENARRALAAPWLGHGPDAYRFLTPKLDGQQPHNVLLQLWLDVGVLGGVPILLLLIAGLVLGARQTRTGSTVPSAGPWFGVLLALTVMGLLDGVFYHALTFWPAMLAWGIVLSPTMRVAEISTRWPSFVGQAAALAAAMVLAFHAWLFHALAVAEPISGPDRWPARLLRAFPTTTFGLWTWTDAWQQHDPATALEWLRWGAAHSPNAALFHIRAANLLLARGDRTAALTELRAAEAKAHWLAQPAISAFRRETEGASR